MKNAHLQEKNSSFIISRKQKKNLLIHLFLRLMIHKNPSISLSYLRNARCFHGLTPPGPPDISICNSRGAKPDAVIHSPYYRIPRWLWCNIRASATDRSNWRDGVGRGHPTPWEHRTVQIYPVDYSGSANIESGRRASYEVTAGMGWFAKWLIGRIFLQVNGCTSL